jgi:hypothetical protein
MRNRGKAIENSYEIISGNVTLMQILTCICFITVHQGGDFPEDLIPEFYIETDQEPTEHQINEMIKYFEKQEEYEKCQYLKEFKLKM